LNGAIYIITQDPRYVGLVQASAATLKRAMPDLPITVFSEFPIEGPFDQVVRVTPTLTTETATGSADFGTLKTADGFYDKSRLMLQSPYERTIFVDADIYVAEPFPELFTLLDRFDCAANHEEYHNTDWFNHYPLPDVPESYPEFNTGILVYRKSPAMQKLLEQWSELYRTYRDQNPTLPINDQPFFREAAYHGEARIATLTRQYNCKFRGQGYLNGPVKLLHGHVNFKLPDVPYAQRVLKIMNGSLGPRVYIANQVYDQKIVGRLVGKRTAHKLGSFPDPESLMVQRMRRLKKVVRERGVGRIVKKLFGRGD
jgi:hypothetical protein